MICKNSPFPVARESHCLTAEASRAEGLLSISLTSATFKYCMIMGEWGQINRVKLSKGIKIEHHMHALVRLLRMNMGPQLWDLAEVESAR